MMRILNFDQSEITKQSWVLPEDEDAEESVLERMTDFLSEARLHIIFLQTWSTGQYLWKIFAIDLTNFWFKISFLWSKNIRIFVRILTSSCVETVIEIVWWDDQEREEEDDRVAEIVGVEDGVFHRVSNNQSRVIVSTNQK